MTAKKSTKRALISSLLILAMCFTMLAGTTFAWFTDSVTSSNNKIVSGKLDIALYLADANNAYNEITANSDPIFGKTDSLVAQNDPQDTLWEPGKTQIAFLQVKNLGNLCARYRIIVDVTDGGLIGSLEFAVLDGVKAGDLNLSTLDWATIKANAATGDLAAGRTEAAPVGALAPKDDQYTVGQVTVDDSDYFALAIHMKETAGNEYQEKDVTIDINVLATQDDVEADAFDNTYDSAATFPVSTAAELTTALQNAPAGSTVELTGNIALTAPVTINNDVTIDGNGNTLITEKPITINGDVTVKDVSFAEPTNAANNATSVYVAGTSEEAVFEGCTFSNPQWEAIQITSNDIKRIVIKDCVFEADNVQGAANATYGNTANECVRYIHVQPDAATGVEIVITGNTFKNCDKVVDSIVGIYYVEGNITVGNNTFEGLEVDANGKSGKLSVHWPENEDMKLVAHWTGAEYTTTIAGA